MMPRKLSEIALMIDSAYWIDLLRKPVERRTKQYQGLTLKALTP